MFYCQESFETSLFHSNTQKEEKILPLIPILRKEEQSEVKWSLHCLFCTGCTVLYIILFDKYLFQVDNYLLTNMCSMLTNGYVWCCCWEVALTTSWMYFDSEIWILRRHTKDKQIQLDHHQHHHHPCICWFVDCRRTHHHPAHFMVIVHGHNCGIAYHRFEMMSCIDIIGISIIDVLILQKIDVEIETQFNWAIKEIYYDHSMLQFHQNYSASSISETFTFFAQIWKSHFCAGIFLCKFTIRGGCSLPGRHHI